MNRAQRNIVETARQARRITVKFEGGGIEDLTLEWNDVQHDIRKLRHEFAIAIQDFFNNYQGGYEPRCDRFLHRHEGRGVQRDRVRGLSRRI